MSHIAAGFCILLPIVNLDLSLVTYLFLSFDNEQVLGELSSVMYQDSPFGIKIFKGPNYI